MPVVRLRICKTVYYSEFRVLLQIVVGIPDDMGESDVYPLLEIALETGTPLMFAGQIVAAKFAKQQFRNLEATSGCQFVAIRLRV